MNLYIIRHADALAVDHKTIKSDEDRPLSEVGLQQVVRLVSAFKRLDVPIERIFSSPLKRAHQTAEELARMSASPLPELIVCEELLPGGSTRKLCKLLRKQQAQHVVLVGHEHDLGLHTRYLIGSKRVHIEYAKGGMALVMSEDPPRKGTGVLTWMLTPNWLNS